MNQRRRAAPILVGCVGEKDLGHNFFGGCAVEQASGLSSHRVLLRLIGKRKDVGREENGRTGLRVARRLSETVVEAAAACSRNVGENTVERDPSFFVGIEALIEEVAQEAPVL